MTSRSIKGVLDSGEYIYTVFILFLSLFVTSEAYSTVIKVPEDYLTIQEGIVASSDGDTVLVAEGTYKEHIDFLGRGIVVRGARSPYGTVIDGDSTGSAVTFKSGEGSGSILENFTITNGLGVATPSYIGGGITVENHSSPVIQCCLIGENFAVYGGGIYCIDSSPVIRNNMIAGNTAGMFGAGIYLKNSNPLIYYNTLISNTAGKWGGGIYCYYSSPEIRCNIIASSPGGGGIYVFDVVSKPVLELNDIWGNTGRDYEGYATPGTGDFSQNPLFITQNKMDGHIKDLSPCKNKGKDLGLKTDFEGNIRPDGGIPDIGADERSTSKSIHIPGDYLLIQKGISEANCMDTIIVSPGTYSENLTISGKILQIISEQGADSTVLDGVGTRGPLLKFSLWHDSLSVFQGFTLKNADTGEAGGILCSKSSPKISSNKILNNSGEACGGIMLKACTAAKIYDNEIRGNQGTKVGGILAQNCTACFLRRNIIAQNQGNEGGGVLIISGNGKTARVENSMIYSNIALSHGGGITSTGKGSVFIYYNTIYGNSSPTGAGIYCSSQSSPAVVDNIISSSKSGAGIYAETDGSNPVIDYNDIFSNQGGNYGGAASPGTGNLEVDPGFIAPKIEDFHLIRTSGCIDKAIDLGIKNDFEHDSRPQGQGFDIGADERSSKEIRIPFDFPTIMQGVEHAFEGCLIMVYPGTYKENIVVDTLNVYILGLLGPDSTVVDGQGKGSVFTVGAGMGKTSGVEGFTIKNGLAESGGGIYCISSSPVIKNNRLTGNEAKFGGAVRVEGSGAKPVISLNEIKSNTASEVGGGISISSKAEPDIKENIIQGNTSLSVGGGVAAGGEKTGGYIRNNTIKDNIAVNGAGIMVQYDALTVIENNVIQNNAASGDGGGIAIFYDALPAILNNRIYGNTTQANGGGINSYRTGNFRIINNVIYGNDCVALGGGIFSKYANPGVVNNIIASQLNGAGIYSTTRNQKPISTYNNIWNNPDGEYGGYAAPGKGDISLDPLFLDPENGDFHIIMNSPCIDAGTSDYSPPVTDFEGDPRIDVKSIPNTGGGAFPWYDIGVDEYKPVSKVDEPDPRLKEGIRTMLYPNAPNPFNPETLIKFYLTQPCHVKLCVYSINGELVSSLLDRSLEPAEYTVYWNGRNAHGEPSGSGVYFLVLDTESDRNTVKMLLLK